MLGKPRGMVRALIIGPTRELTEQTHQVVRRLGETGIRSASIYGGVSIQPQIKTLRKGVDIVSACPGRLLDHITRGTIDVSQTEVLVLDEADRMFDMGFLPDIRKIVKHLPKKRQTLLFSATMPPDINVLAREILQDPKTIQVGLTAPPDTVAHTFYPVDTERKTTLLKTILDTTDTGPVLVFTRTKQRAKRLSGQLEQSGYKSTALHGDRSQDRENRPAFSPAAASRFPGGRGGSASAQAERPWPPAAADYPGAKRVQVPHPQLHPGDPCPDCKQGKLYLLKRPAQIVRITAQSLFAATRFELEKLRCKLCGKTFTAPAPPEAGLEKDDPNVGPAVGYCALWRRAAALPLGQDADRPGRAPARLHAMGTHGQSRPGPQPVQEALVTLAAQGHLIHNDDTTMRVQSLTKESGAATPGKERTGIFTTSLLSEVEGHRIALFFTGHHHAGENLDRVAGPSRQGGLTRPSRCATRSRATLPRSSKRFWPIAWLMADDSSWTSPKTSPPSASTCSKAWGKFINTTRRPKRPGSRRRPGSASTRSTVRRSWTTCGSGWSQQLESRESGVEPNSGLGQAIHYMLNHWEPLTLFLRQAGAPLDNNICERALKMAILHRKNSLGYKTQNGARLGDLFMSLIHTSRLCAGNPLDYLNAVVRHAKEAREHPTRWFPWNYKQALPTDDTG